MVQISREKWPQWAEMYIHSGQSELLACCLSARDSGLSVYATTYHQKTALVPALSLLFQGEAMDGEQAGNGALLCGCLRTVYTCSLLAVDAAKMHESSVSEKEEMTQCQGQ